MATHDRPEIVLEHLKEHLPVFLAKHGRRFGEITFIDGGKTIAAMEPGGRGTWGWHVSAAAIDTARVNLYVDLDISRSVMLALRFPKEVRHDAEEREHVLEMATRAVGIAIGDADWHIRDVLDNVVTNKGKWIGVK